MRLTNTTFFAFIGRTAQIALVGGAFLSLGVYLWVACARMNYPFELEWMEGGSVDHVRRILDGQALYVKPSLDFIPYIYTPLYFYISALVAKVAGIGFFPLRLVAFLSSLGCLSLIFLIVTRETRAPRAGLLASGLFAATFRIGGAWFDLARPDMVFLVCLLAAVYSMRHQLTVITSIWAGVWMALAFLAKQTAFSIALPLMLYYLVVNWRCAVGFMASVGGLIGGSTALFDHLSQGWYRYYIFHVPAQLPPAQSEWINFWRIDLLQPLSVALCLSILFFWLPTVQPQKNTRLFYGCLTVGMVGGAWLSKVYAGGYANNSIPAHAVLCILCGLAIPAIQHRAQTLPPSLRLRFQGYLSVICVIQFAILLYNPFKQIPTPADKQAGQELIARVSQIEGEVWIPAHGYLSVLAGKRSTAHEMAISNLLKSQKPDPVQDQLYQEMLHAIRAQRFAAILLDHPWWFSPDMDDAYRECGAVFAQSDVFWPVTGHRTRPESMCFSGNRI